MARNPEDFRGMTPSQIMATLIVDESLERHSKARAIGAQCASCMDTGMAGGAFCGCSAGSKLGLQSRARMPLPTPPVEEGKS